MHSIPVVDRHRRGLTLVELLTVIVIIGVLAALSVPALSRAIARSQQTQCTNNLYQLGFALLRYDEQHGGIPGWLNDSPNVTTGTITTGTGCSWTVPLMPMLGRGDIYDAWPQLPNNPTVEGFICPSNRPGRGVDYPAVQYAANAGAGVIADLTVSGTDKGDGVFKNRMSVWDATAQKWKQQTSPVSLDMIAESDGAATTLAFAEKSSLGFQPHAWAFERKTPLEVTYSPFGAGASWPAVFGVAATVGPTRPVINNALISIRNFAPSSGHAGGVVVVFCDGHTGFLRDTLQPHEYAQLLTRRSRWQGTANKTNTPGMQPWLLRSGQPYLLDEKILR